VKAFFATAYGGPEVMRFGEVPDPAAGPGQVLVEVRAASVNPVDVKVRQGAARLLSGRSFPKVLGTDFSGTIAASGDGAAGLAAGAAVIGTTRILFGAAGAHAERVVVPATRVFAMPAGMSFEAAAALPVAALTALSGLRAGGDLQGKAVLVNGATGGVGHLAVQIAKARGARVTAVCSARNHDRALALGADDALDYLREDFTRGRRRWDVILDAHGHLPLSAALRVLAERGVLATTLPGPGTFVRAAWQRIAGGPRIALANLRDRPQDYEELTRLLALGQVSPVVARVLPLERAAEAFGALEAGGTVGKVVIRVS
jgi:NADPH:quinone reductase-like Zn-dependent oxidoreductase